MYGIESRRSTEQREFVSAVWGRMTTVVMHASKIILKGYDQDIFRGKKSKKSGKIGSK